MTFLGGDWRSITTLISQMTTKKPPDGRYSRVGFRLRHKHKHNDIRKCSRFFIVDIFLCTGEADRVRLTMKC